MEMYFIDLNLNKINLNEIKDENVERKKGLISNEVC